MTTFLIVRHGQSLGNRDGLFLGVTDLGLSPRGVRQAEATAAFLRDRRIHAVFTSSLCRAAQTVRPEAEARGLSLTPLAGLREIDGGLWENLTFAEIQARYPAEYGVWASDIGRAGCPGGETTRALWSRFFQTLTALAWENDGRTLLLGTHATPLRFLRCRLRGFPPEECGTREVGWPGNASVTEVVFQDGVWQMVSDAEDAHLAGL